MNSLVKASMRAAVAGVPEFGPACPYCDARDANDGAAVRVKSLISFPRCRDCGSFLVTQDTVFATRPQPSFDRRLSYWQARANWIREELGYAPRRILDVECGYGEFLEAWPWTARREGISSASAEDAAVPDRGLRIFYGSLFDAEPGQEYDIVTWYTGLHSANEFKRTIRRIGPWVASGGLLAIGHPTLECRRHGNGERPRTEGWFEDGVQNMGCPSRDWLEQTVESFGFLPAGNAWTSGGLPPVHPALRATGKGGEKIWSWLADRSPLTQSPIFDYAEMLFRRQ